MKFIYTLLVLSMLYTCTICAQSDHLAFLPQSVVPAKNQESVNKQIHQTGPIQSKDIFNGPISIHPNPATDYFKINTEEKIGQVQLINLLGKLVRQYDAFHGDRYDLYDIPSGIYFVKIDHLDSNKSKTLRLKVQ